MRNTNFAVYYPTSLKSSLYSSTSYHNTGTDIGRGRGRARGEGTSTSTSTSK